MIDKKLMGKNMMEKKLIGKNMMIKGGKKAGRCTGSVRLFSCRSDRLSFTFDTLSLQRA